MANQIELAKKDINNLEAIIDSISMTNPGIAKSLFNKFESDKSIQSFLNIYGKTGNDVLSSELALRARNRIKGIMDEALKYRSGMSGIFDWFSSSDDASQDRPNGLDILRSYYNIASTYPNYAYSSFDAFISDAESKVPDYATTIGELVRMNVASTTVDQAKSRVSDLATKSQGQASLSQIVMAAGGSGDTINWAYVVPNVAEETAVGASEAVANVLASTGSGVLGTLNLLKYLPWILGGAAVLYIVVLASKHGASSAKVIEEVGHAAAERMKRNPRKRVIVKRKKYGKK